MNTENKHAFERFTDYVKTVNAAISEKSRFSPAKSMTREFGEAHDVLAALDVGGYLGFSDGLLDVLRDPLAFWTEVEGETTAGALGFPVYRISDRFIHLLTAVRAVAVDTPLFTPVRSTVHDASPLDQAVGA